MSACALLCVWVCALSCPVIGVFDKDMLQHTCVRMGARWVRHSAACVEQTDKTRQDKQTNRHIHIYTYISLSSGEDMPEAGCFALACLCASSSRTVSGVPATLSQNCLLLAFRASQPSPSYWRVCSVSLVAPAPELYDYCQAHFQVLEHHHRCSSGECHHHSSHCLLISLLSLCTS